MAQGIGAGRWIEPQLLAMHLDQYQSMIEAGAGKQGDSPLLGCAHRDDAGFDVEGLQKSNQKRGFVFSIAAQLLGNRAQRPNGPLLGVLLGPAAADRVGHIGVGRRHFVVDPFFLGR